MRVTLPVPGSSTTPGVRRASSLKPRPFSGRSTICRFVMTCPRLPDSELSSGTVELTSITELVSPSVRSKSSSRSLPTCISTPFCTTVRKPDGRHVDLIDPGIQRRHHVFAGAFRKHFLGYLGFGVGDGDGSVGHHGLVRIVDRAGDSSGLDLREGSAAGQKEWRPETA